MRLDDSLKSHAKAMRQNPTPFEAKLWHELRAHRFADHKFTRQTVIGPYIVDFAARAERLIVEVDGDSHGARIDYDARRTAFLEREGYRVLRFTNEDVRLRLEGVLASISDALRTPPSPHPSPPGGRAS